MSEQTEPTKKKKSTRRTSTRKKTTADAALSKARPSEPKAEKPRIIFNSSMPRSGSELLQVLLHQNPRIYGSATSPLLEYQFACRNQRTLPEVRAQLQNLMDQSFINLCSDLAYAYYRDLTDRPIVCDKNRGWSHYYEWVQQWHPEKKPRMICMVRDLRDIIASFERIYRENRDLPIGPDVPVQLQNLTLEERCHHWLNTAPVGLALRRTKDLIARDLTDDILFVRYEDLCDEPDVIMDQIYEYLEEEPFEHDFDNIKKEIEEDHTVFGPYGNHQVHSKLKPVRHNGWKDVLDKDIAKAIRDNFGWYFDEFQY